MTKEERKLFIKARVPRINRKFKILKDQAQAGSGDDIPANLEHDMLAAYNVLNEIKILLKDLKEE